MKQGKLFFSGWSQSAGLAVACILFVLPAAGSQELQDAGGAFWDMSSVDTPWSLRGSLELGSRRFAADAERLELDVRRFTVGGSAQVAYATYVWGEVGAVEVDARGRAGASGEFPVAGSDDETAPASPWFEQDQKGDTGLAWGVGAGVILMQAVIDESPVLGLLETLRLEVQISHRRARSDLPAARRFVRDPATGVAEPAPGYTAGDKEELSWSDTRLTPMVVYSRNNRTDQERASFDPTGYSLHVGVSLYRTRADYGSMSFDDDSGVGLELGSDLRLPSGWIGRLHGSLLDSSNREIALSVIRRF